MFAVFKCISFYFLLNYLFVKSCLFKHLDDCDNKIGCSSKDTCPKRHVVDVDKPKTEYNDLPAPEKTDKGPSSASKTSNSNIVVGRSIAYESGQIPAKFQLLNSSTFPSTSGASVYQPIQSYSNTDSHMVYSTPDNPNQPKSTFDSQIVCASPSNSAQLPTYYGNANIASYDSAPGFDNREYYYNDSSFHVSQEPSDYNSNSCNSNQYYGYSNQRTYPVKRLDGCAKNVACR